MLGFLGQRRTLAKTGMLEECGHSDWGKKKKTFRESWVGFMAML